MKPCLTTMLGITNMQIMTETEKDLETEKEKDLEAEKDPDQGPENSKEEKGDILLLQKRLIELNLSISKGISPSWPKYFSGRKILSNMELKNMKNFGTFWQNIK